MEISNKLIQGIYLLKRLFIIYLSSFIKKFVCLLFYLVTYLSLWINPS